MKKILSKIINYFFSFFKIQNKIVFEAGRDLIDGNARAIYEYMVKNCPDSFRLIWIVSKKADVSMLRKKDYVRYYTLGNYYHLATAKYWIRSQCPGSIIKKRKEQIYIQLWHGNGAMKLMGYDSTNEKNRPPMDHVKEWDWYIANDELDAQHIISSSGYNKKCEILGVASMDISLRISKDKKFKKDLLLKLGVKDKDLKKRIVFYAPTFRDFDLEKDIIKLPINKLSTLNDSLILVRLHPLVREKIDNSIFENQNFINANNYPDAADILAISDILITDYSSIFYQYGPLNGLTIFYPYDFEDYKKLRGGFYLDYEKDLPGPICYNEKELLELLQNAEKLKIRYSKKLEKFNKRFNYLADGNACKRFVDKLLDGYFEKERER